MIVRFHLFTITRHKFLYICLFERVHVKNQIKSNLSPLLSEREKKIQGKLTKKNIRTLSKKGKPFSSNLKTQWNFPSTTLKKRTFAKPFMRSMLFVRTPKNTFVIYYRNRVILVKIKHKETISTSSSSFSMSLEHRLILVHRKKTNNKRFHKK